MSHINTYVKQHLDKIPSSKHSDNHKNKVVRIASPSRRSDQPAKINSIKMLSSKLKERQMNNVQPNGDQIELPLRIDYSRNYPNIRWSTSFNEINYKKWLPVFLEGLSDTTYPANIVAERGCYQLIENGGEKILSAIPFCVEPLKYLLQSDQTVLKVNGMNVLQKLATDVPYGGEALVPHYYHLLSPLARFKYTNVNVSDKTEDEKKKLKTITEMIHETLKILEKNGGDDAYAKILNIFPTYVSCLRKK